MAAFRCVLLVVVIGLLTEWGGCMAAGGAIQQFEEVDGSSETAYDGQLRDLLRKRRKSRKKVNKKKIDRARSAAANSNESGVLINQQDAVNIKGNGNAVAGGRTGRISNIKIKTGDIIDECRALCEREECTDGFQGCLNFCEANGVDLTDYGIGECCDDLNCAPTESCSFNPPPSTCV